MKSLKKLIAALLALCVISVGFAEFGVKSANAEITGTYDWHLYYDGSYIAKMPIPKTYTVRDTFRTFQSDTNAVFNAPTDMFIDDDDNIYVVDSGNNRIVKLNSEGEIIIEISSLECVHPEGEECEHTIGSAAFNRPGGIFVNSNYIYVADTGNSRVVQLDLDGHFIRNYTRPNDPALDGYPFNVTKVAVSERGIMYLTLETDFQGFLQLNLDGDYMGNTGMTRVTTNFISYLWSRLSSQSLVERTTLTAPPYSNFTIDSEGWLYATVITVTSNQIVKLNSVGTNVYGNGESITYGRDFDEITDSTTFETEHYSSNFVDVAVDDDGIIYALDDALGNVFLYDQDGNNLAYFGGIGSNRGKFRRPVAIDYMSDGSVAVLDAETGYITVFEPTVFCELMIEGTTLYRNADYNKAREVWTELLKLDANYIYAHKAIARAYYKEYNYQAAMDSYKLAKDKEGYSQAFEARKNILTRQYFFLIVVIVIALIVGVVLGYRKLRKYVDKLHIKVTTWGGDDE